MENSMVLEYLAVREWEKLRNRHSIQKMWHENWLKVQEIGIEEYEKQFDYEKNSGNR